MGRNTLQRLGIAFLTGPQRRGTGGTLSLIGKRIGTVATRPCSLYFAYYNFCRVHSTLRVTPGMEAGIADHVWGIEELVSLLGA